MPSSSYFVCVARGGWEGGGVSASSLRGVVRAPALLGGGNEHSGEKHERGHDDDDALPCPRRECACRTRRRGPRSTAAPWPVSCVCVCVRVCVCVSSGMAHARTHAQAKRRQKGKNHHTAQHSTAQHSTAGQGRARTSSPTFRCARPVAAFVCVCVRVCVCVCVCVGVCVGVCVCVCVCVRAVVWLVPGFCFFGLRACVRFIRLVGPIFVAAAPIVGGWVL